MTQNLKLLSICMQGRNDNYGEKFVERLSNSINYLARNAKRLERLEQIEINITDWGSETPLSEVVKLTPDGSKISQFIFVPNEISENESSNIRGYHAIKAQNVALRRSQGKYICMMVGDALVAEAPLSQLLKLLSGELLTSFNKDQVGMAVRRKFLPYEFEEDDANTDFRRLEKYCEIADVHFTRNSFPGLMSGNGMIVFERSLIHDHHGLNEELQNWGGDDIQLMLMLNSHIPLIDLIGLDIYVYDFVHAPEQLKIRKAGKNKVQEIPNRYNNEEWGLGKITLPFSHGEPKVFPQNKQTRAHSKLTVPIKESKPLESKSIVDQLLDTRPLRDIVKNLPLQFPHILTYHYPLVWFAKNRKCFKYLEYENGTGFGSVILSHLNPCSELYLNLPTLFENREVNDMKYPLNISTMLREKHKGHIRFISGNPETSLERIKESFVGSMIFDLIVLNLSLFTEHENEILLNKAISHLSGNGGIIIHSQHIDQIMTMSHYLKSAHHDLDFIDVRKAGVIFLLKQPKGIFKNLDNLGKNRFYQSWKPIKRNSFAYFFVRLFTKLKDFSSRLLLVEYRFWF